MAGSWWRGPTAATRADLKTRLSGQIFNADGTRSGNIFTINASATDLEKFTRITALDNGGFAAT